MRSVKLAKDETVITQATLDRLLAKEKAHDAYLWATQRMADKDRTVQDVLVGQAGNTTEDERLRSYAKGYHTALWDFAQLVVDAPSKD